MRGLVHLAAFGAALLVLLLVGIDAQAGGFQYPTHGAVALGRGGAFTAKADDLVALEYNPAGLLHNKGTILFLSNNITDFNLKFRQYDMDGNLSSPVENDANPFFFSPVLGVSTDLLHPRIRVALGVYGPNAYGRSSYDPDGPQRFMLTDTDIMLAFYSAAVAWQPAENFGLGLTFHWIHMLKARFGMMANGWWQDGIEYADKSWDVGTDLTVSDPFSWAMTLGTWWRPIPRIEIGASFRFPTASIEASGDMDLNFVGDTIEAFYQAGIESNGDQGLVAYDSSGNQVDKLPVSFKMNIPMIGRLGVRYRHPYSKDEELFDIEADVVWEGWHAFENYRVDINGYMMMVGDGVQDAEQLNFNPVILKKNFKDTWSFRLGGDCRIAKWLQARLGGYYETGAVPEEYTNIDFASFDRIGIGGGLTFRYKWVDFSVGYSHIFQAKRTVAREDTEVYMQFPMAPEGPVDKHRVGGGTYETSYDIFAFSVLTRL